MTRLPDWEARLSAYIASVRTRPHEYGQHDCILHPAAVIEAVTGDNPGEKHRGKYKTKTGAARYLKKLGFGSPEQAIDSILEPKPAGFAQRGDLILATDGIPAVCMGAFAYSAGEQGEFHGLVKVPRCDWVKAWRVG